MVTLRPDQAPLTPRNPVIKCRGIFPSWESIETMSAFYIYKDFVLELGLVT
jgi:hypothetical protein